MIKELSDMTLEEMWRLFPIVLKNYNPEYPHWYEQEKNKLLDIVKEGSVIRISHIGSTAVPGIISKPTIDILMEININCDTTYITNTITLLKWNLMNVTENPFKQTYQMGYTKFGFEEKVYHLHVRYAGDWGELYFKDYLIEHEEVAREYEVLKKQLKEMYEHNRDAYTQAKEEFVTKYTDMAKIQYGNRYKISGV